MSYAYWDLLSAPQEKSGLDNVCHMWACANSASAGAAGPIVAEI